MKTKKITAIILGCLLTAGILGGCGSAATNASSDNKKTDNGKQVTLRLADIQPADYVTVRADNEFKKIVEQKSNGRIKVEVYPGGQLGDEKSSCEQVQFGAVDLARVSIAPLAEFDKELNVLMLPYIYANKDQMFRVLDGPIGDKIMTNLQNSKIVGLGWLDAGARNFYNTKKDVKTPDDLKGLKIRVQESGLMMDMVKALGASATPMAYGEVYSGLQTGVIDGAENNWLSYLSTNHYEVAKHITIDEHTRVPEMFIASKMTMDKLSKEDQQILKDAGKEAAKYERSEWLKDEDAAMKKVADKGAIITKLDSNKAFQDKVKPLYDKYGKDYKDIIQQIMDTK